MICIRSATCSNATASMPTYAWEMGDEEPVDVEVLIDADQAAWGVANAGMTGAVVDQRDGGAVVVRLRVTNRAALRSWAIGFLDHAEILSPPSERQAYIEWLTAVATR